MSLFSKLSSISMQQVVNLIEDEDESWPEEAESLSPRVKQARRCKSSKSYGYRFDLVLREADNQELGIVKCNLCPATLSKSGTKGLKGHVAFHSGKSVTPSESEFKKTLLKFVICSAQPFRLVDDLSFIEFLESFRLLAIESFKMNVIKKAKDFLPCGHTISRQIDDACSTVQNHVSTDVSNLMLFGGGLTLDFAKNRVDYLAVTGHYIGHNWLAEKNMVLLFEPVPGMQKTADNVRLLVESKLGELGLNQWEKLFVTTDEGSNVNGIGGMNHQPCLCHIGATIAKRCCVLYKDSCLSSEAKQMCTEVNSSLNTIEKIIAKIRQNEAIRSKANEALKLPAQTRWLSYYSMVVALKEKNHLLEPFRENNSLVSDLLAIVKLSRINAYVDVLKPIADMVIDFQAEKEPTSNKILGHAVTIWLDLQAMMALEDGCSLFRISLAAAALEAFNRKFGDFSEENWHSSSSGRINKKLVVCAAFLDPFEHSQLKTMCDLAPGLDYDMIKKTVINEVRLLTPVDFVRVPVSSRCARFAQGGQNAIEKEVNSYTALLSIGESPLNFWRNNEKYFPYLATLARYLLSVPASSSPSERTFKELRCIMVDFTRNQMSAAKIASLIHIRTSFFEQYLI